MKEKLFYLLQELKDNFSEILLEEVLNCYWNLEFDVLFNISEKEKELFEGQRELFYKELTNGFIDDLNDSPLMYFLGWSDSFMCFNTVTKRFVFSLLLEQAEGTDAADFIKGFIELNEDSPESALMYFNRIDSFVSFYFTGLCYKYLPNNENAVKCLKIFLEKFDLELLDLKTKNDLDLSEEHEVLITKWNLYLDLGYCSSRIAQYYDAIEYYKKAIEIFDIKNWYSIHIEYANNGDNQSMNDFEILINNYLEALEKTGNYDKGIEVLKFLVAKYPDGNYYKTLLTRFKEYISKYAFADQIIANIFKPKTPFNIEKFEATKLISKEKILEDMIVEQIKYGFKVFGRCLEIYQDNEIFGRQYYIKSVNGILDLLLIDKTDNALYLVELKRNEAGVEVVDQIEKYIVGLSKQLNRKINGIICLHRPDEELKKAVRSKTEIELFTYHFDFKQIE